MPLRRSDPSRQHRPSLVEPAIVDIVIARKVTFGGLGLVDRDGNLPWMDRAWRPIDHSHSIVAGGFELIS